MRVLTSVVLLAQILIGVANADIHNNDKHPSASLERLTLDEALAATDRFRAIHTATWREDWPDKRGPEIARVRQLVQEATADGGRAIVVPARTTGQGPAREFLDGLDFELGSGFAPHPRFVAWFEEQVEEGVRRIQSAQSASLLSARGKIIP